jgi:peroxiredoxin
MAKTPSQMIELGTRAKIFSLPDTEGNIVTLEQFAQKPLLVMFISNHCPFVKHVRSQLAEIGKEFGPRGLGIVAINSNDVANYPDDSPEKMKEEVKLAGYTFPYLFDETQEVAKNYGATCTPDFFLFDRSHRLFYRGQLDDSRPGNEKPVTGESLRIAISAALKGQKLLAEQRASLGCNIKWKPGNEPEYYKS